MPPAPPQGGPTIAVTTEPITQCDVIDVTVYGGTPGDSGTLEINDGGENTEDLPFTYNDKGHAVVRVTIPSTWGQINFSVDDSTWTDDENRALLPKT